MPLPQLIRGRIDRFNDRRQILERVQDGLNFHVLVERRLEPSPRTSADAAAVNLDRLEHELTNSGTSEYWIGMAP